MQQLKVKERKQQDEIASLQQLKEEERKQQLQIQDLTEKLVNSTYANETLKRLKNAPMPGSIASDVADIEPLDIEQICDEYKAEINQLKKQVEDQQRLVESCAGIEQKNSELSSQLKQLQTVKTSLESTVQTIRGEHLKLTEQLQQQTAACKLRDEEHKTELQQLETQSRETLRQSEESKSEILRFNSALQQQVNTLTTRLSLLNARLNATANLNKEQSAEQNAAFQNAVAANKRLEEEKRGLEEELSKTVTLLADKETENKRLVVQIKKLQQRPESRNLEQELANVKTELEQKTQELETNKKWLLENQQVLLKARNTLTELTKCKADLKELVAASTGVLNRR